MKRVDPIINPSKKDLLTLRFMIVIGLISMGLFLRELLSAEVQSRPLYWMLMTTMLFVCLKSIHEWIHYFKISVPAKQPQQKVYTVDIFTTFCKGEPYEMIEETLLAIKAITYPHQTYLCDESNDPYLKQFCEELDIHHVTRTLKINAKAGNINNALKISTGELCVVLDPDHVPFPDFLDPIVDQFNDPEIGFVQIVQSYKNADRSLIAKGAAQQTFQFYGPMMMTMNSYGTVLAIGANCTFRREALNSIGGHAAGLAEDMHTAMQLHAKGWKSMYVPAVLARGLVPTTLSAYYSQQLKWARGVFDLLATAYPKLFTKFTWQQKLHYATLPIHYLSGVIFLINFLIPILSLVFDTSPLDIDFTRFLTLALPLTGMIFLIRLYVQKWVMEEEERGFHVVGGLLMIGTWWIFILGFVYTLLRKKIPYIPTPKDDTEEDNWHLSIPNFIIITASILAVAYGLYNDWNPYNLIMSGFAAFNCLILGFTILASRQHYIRTFSKAHKAVDTSFTTVANFKTTFWLLRRRVYSEVRSKVLILTLLIIGFFLFTINGQMHTEETSEKEVFRRDIFILGLFAPQQNDGLSSMTLVNKASEESALDFGIISLYLPWGDEPRCELPLPLIDSIHRRNAIPMISWEPWQNLFKGEENKKDSKVFQQITSGKYDNYLDRFSKQIKKIDKPVFIRFAHEADNPQYPWSAAGENTPEEFKAAWQYVYAYFEKNKAHNVIWVWNPWKPEAVEAYFPGKNYVDWIGITSLNYASNNKDGKTHSMRDLYAPFHRKSLFRSGLPVMLAEFGSLGTKTEQLEWMKNAFQASRLHFPEIKSFVLFNSKEDHNTLDANQTTPFDWSISALKNLGLAAKEGRTLLTWIPSVSQQVKSTASTTNSKALVRELAQIKGVNYAKGKNWTTNGHALKTNEIRSDFKEMSSIGINHVKYYGLNFYDTNVLRVAKEQKLDITYAFWLPERFDLMSDHAQLDKLSDLILKKVRSLKNNKEVVMWNIANTPLSKFKYLYYQPDTYTAQQDYLSWLSDLVNKIKAIDQRPLSVDVTVDSETEKSIDLLEERVPEIDAYGLVFTKNSRIDRKELNVPHFYSSINIDRYVENSTKGSGLFVSTWQDETTTNFVSLNGLKGPLGFRKPAYHLVAHKFVGKALPEALPPIKVLVPSVTLMEQSLVKYHALVYIDKQWRIASKKDGFGYRWDLIQYDRDGTPIKVTALGTGIDVTLTVPQDISRYRIALYVTKQSHVSIVDSKLNIPIY